MEAPPVRGPVPPSLKAVPAVLSVPLDAAPEPEPPQAVMDRVMAAAMAKARNFLLFIETSPFFNRMDILKGRLRSKERSRPFNP